MENKTKYYNLLTENKGQLNEIALGEKIGLDEDETQELIAQLLCEHSIAYVENKVCKYSVIKKQKKGR